jgi:hypothetical protein
MDLGTGNENVNAWEPATLEDRLLQAYSKTHPGTLYLEVPVRLLSEPGRERRMDAVRIPGTTTQFLEASDYSMAEVTEAIRGQSIHVIEAKYALNRGVIGQVLVAQRLVARVMEPSEILMDVVCVEGNPDLEEFCAQQGIEVSPYPQVRPESTPSEPDASPSVERVDERRPPDSHRRGAFLAGWTAGAEGRLYESVRQRKTHANMGNLFGLIYGDQPAEFRLATWRRYLEYAVSPQQEDEGSGD